MALEAPLSVNEAMSEGSLQEVFHANKFFIKRRAKCLVSRRFACDITEFCLQLAVFDREVCPSDNLIAPKQKIDWLTFF